MTSDPARARSSWLCPGCDVEPPQDLAAPICPSCGAKLVEIKPRGEDLTGQVIDGRFEIRGLLGEGGMGTVYRAWQRSIGRELAIKLIDARHSRDSMAVRRFLREARLASQLSQPNTVSVFDFGQAGDGRLFIAMELVRGRTLADVLEADGVFSVARAAWIGVQLCDALDAAHRLQIVHRDLKPANVVVLDDPPGRDLVKVLDFGLAKSLKDTESHATDTGLVVGTPRYMAPEVVMGESPTPQSDLYAVGVILGELVTGKALWDATTFPALAGQKLAPSPVVDELPGPLRTVVAQLIAPEVGDRPTSASQVRQLLRPLVLHGEMPVPFTGPARAIKDEPARPATRMTGPTVAARGGGAIVPDASTVTDTPTPGPITGIPELPSTAARLATDSRLAVAATPSGVGRAARRARAIVVAAAVVIAAAIALVIVVASGRGHRSTRARGPGPGTAPITTVDAAPSPTALIDAGAPPPPAIDAAPIATVTVRVTSRPSGAPVRVDGVDRGLTPAEVAVPRGTTAIAVEVTLGGRVVKKAVVPDRDRTVELAAPRGGKSGLPF